MPVVEGTGERRERVVDADLVEPAPRGGILEVLQQRYLLKLLVTRQLAQQYAGSLLGLMWSYIQPAMRFGVYYLVFGFIINFHDDIPYFAVHLFTGIVVVHYFAETWGGGTRSIWQNRALVQKMRMPREIFPVAAMAVAAYHTLPQVILLTLIDEYLGARKEMSARAAESTMPELFRRAQAFERAFVKAGGLLGAGVDPTGVGGALPGFGDQRNFELLIEAGFSAVEAIQIMTYNGARILGVDKDLGSVAPGKIADLVVIRGDLIARPAEIRQTTIVFKDGVEYDSAKMLSSVKGLVGIR